MNEERRRYPRLAQPFEGTWRGASGATTCRLADIGLGGCFVESLSMPTPGEATIVSVIIGLNLTLTFTGRVVYVDPGIGFAVQFTELGQREIEELHRLFDALK